MKTVKDILKELKNSSKCWAIGKNKAWLKLKTIDYNTIEYFILVKKDDLIEKISINKNGEEQKTYSLLINEEIFRFAKSVFGDDLYEKDLNEKEIDTFKKSLNNYNTVIDLPDGKIFELKSKSFKTHFKN